MLMELKISIIYTKYELFFWCIWLLSVSFSEHVADDDCCPGCRDLKNYFESSYDRFCCTVPSLQTRLSKANISVSLLLVSVDGRAAGNAGIMSANSTFLSYIEDQAVDHSKASTDHSKSRLDVVDNGHLLPGEVECAFCDECSFGFSFSGNTFGRVLCTNFRVRLQPVAWPEGEQSARFKSFHEKYDIPLCSIHSVFYAPVKQNQSTAKKKFIPVTSSLSSLEVVSCIRLHLKDFRVVLIDLRGSQNGVSLLNQIFFFSRPVKIDNIIQSGAQHEWRGKLSFTDSISWENELKRCGQRKNDYWRVCSQYPHGARQFVHSYPMYFVVPAELVQHDLDRMAVHWQLSRFPIWVWSSPMGMSLLRSSNFDENWEAPQLNDKLKRCVARATKAEQRPLSISLSTDITPLKIASCYDRLRRYCSSESYEQFAARDKDWLARISHSGWLQLVSYCLLTSAETVDALVDNNCSVILYEEDGQDISAVVSSLAQICCDPHFRTMEGLDSLIAKEWIALGHPFALRLHGVGNGTNEGLIAPTFLLFLDCLAQLIRLYPTQFSYSQHVLIALWDLSLTGMVPAFSASSVADQLATTITGGPFPLERFFDESYTHLFANVANFGAKVVQKATGSPLFYDILRPPRSIVDVQLWNECYLRWIPPANVTCGGEVISSMALKEVIGEVFPETEDVLANIGPTNVDEEKVSSAHPYSTADVTHRGYFAGRDALDTMSLSSMSMSTCSQTVDDRWKATKSPQRTPISLHRKRFMSSNTNPLK
ncbi:hypothetical protein Q1695_008645 [Nippostrongylus brasiliensis]|nr:hypothetical protein Q1695_008645 [Nippostrongylus brasiliensis]